MVAIKNLISISRTNLFLTTSLLIAGLLFESCVAKYSKNQEGNPRLIIQNRNFMRSFLDPYFGNEKKQLDTLKDYHFAFNDVWILINDSSQPVNLNLIYNLPDSNGKMPAYNFLLDQKKNKISLSRMKPGVYNGEFKRGTMVRRFQLAVEDYRKLTLNTRPAIPE